MDHKSIRARVFGRVQGVGYRAWTVKTATQLGIIGWVKNCEDGSVELQAQGVAQALKTLEELLWRGPASSRVKGVEIVSIPHDATMSGFVIRS